MAVFLSANDAAKILGVTAQMVRLYERAGKLRALRTAGGMRSFSERKLKHSQKKEEASGTTLPRPERTGDE